MEPSRYYTINRKDLGLDFTKAFYDLSLRDKIACLTTLEESPDPEVRTRYLMDRTMHRAASALLQHSPPESQRQYPCTGIRRLSKKAREADASEADERQAEMELHGDEPEAI